MRVYNQTEKAAFAMRRKGTVNGEKSAAPKIYTVYYCGQPIYQSVYYHFCKCEINRLVATGIKKESLKIKY